jgi:hypothetical protein
MKVNKLIVFCCSLIFFAVLLIGSSVEAGSLQATNTTKWTEAIRGFTTFASVVAACLAWAAQLVWSQQFRDAKEAEITTLRTANQQLEGDLKSRRDDYKEFLDTLQVNHRLAIEAKDEAIRTLEQQIDFLDSDKLKIIEQNERNIQVINHIHSEALNTMKEKTSSVIIDYNRKAQEEFERIIQEQQSAIEDLLRDRDDLLVRTKVTNTNLSVIKKIQNPPVISYETNEISRTVEAKIADNKSPEETLEKILAVSAVLASKSLGEYGNLTSGFLKSALETVSKNYMDIANRQ